MSHFKVALGHVSEDAAGPINTEWGAPTAGLLYLCRRCRRNRVFGAYNFVAVCGSGERQRMGIFQQIDWSRGWAFLEVQTKGKYLGAAAHFLPQATC